MKINKYVVIETTTHCNLKCSYCNREEVVGDKLQHMSFLNFRDITDKIVNKYQVTDLKLMSMGEPFMNPEIGLIFKHARKKYDKAHIICATNCQHSNFKDFEVGLNYIDEIYLSIDGIDKIYEQMRYPGKWKKVINFLDTINKLEGKAKLTINMVVSEKNHHQIKDVYQLSKFYNIDNFKINIAQEWSINSKMKIAISEEFLENLKKYEKFIAGKRVWDYKDCFWPVKGIYIDTFGKLRICNIKTDSEPIGDIYQESIASILQNNIKLNNVRNSCMSNTPDMHCKNCSYKELTNVFSQVYN